MFLQGLEERCRPYKVEERSRLMRRSRERGSSWGGCGMLWEGLDGDNRVLCDVRER